MARLTEISAELAQVAEEAQECRAEFDRENTAEDWAAVQYALTQAEQAVASTAASLRSIDQKIGSIDAQLESRAEAMKRIQAHQEQANEGAKRAAIYETLKAAFSQDGIPHNIIRTIIPVLEATATNILGQMSGGRMSVEFVTEKTLKSNSKKEVTTLDIIINDTSTGPLPYMSRSGGSASRLRSRSSWHWRRSRAARRGCSLASCSLTSLLSWTPTEYKHTVTPLRPSSGDTAI